MSDNSGYIVTYQTKEGLTQKGIVRHSEQVEAFTSVNKAFIRLVNDDLSFKTDLNGKKLITLKATDLLIKIGFVD